MATTLLRSLTTKADIRQIMTIDYAGKTFSQLEDLQGEITDGIMPIYYNEIVGEWQAMPSEYNGKGVAEFGLPEPDKITIYRLMELDLFAYYSDLVAGVLWELSDSGYFDESEAN